MPLRTMFRMRCHRRSHLLAAVVLALACGACATATNFDALMQSWNGHTRGDLVRTWGAPVYVYTNSAGGVVFVYVPAAAAPADTSSSRPRSLGGDEDDKVPQPRGEYLSSMAATWPIHRIFFIGEDGKIYRSQWRGDWVCCSM